MAKVPGPAPPIRDHPKHSLTTSLPLHGPLDPVSSASARCSGRGGHVPFLENKPWQKLAAVYLGYDRHGWQAEEFKHSGQRFVDWEEVARNRYERGVEIGREGIGLWRVVDDDAGSACSDSELILGHDAEHDLGIGWCYAAYHHVGHDGQSRLGRCNVCGCKDTLDLLAEPGRRSSCQGAYAAYRPRGGYYGSRMLEDWCRPDWSYGLRAL